MKSWILGIALALVSAGANAQLSTQERAERVFEQMRASAERLYPALTRAKTLPDDILIGLLVDNEGHVLQHSVMFKTQGAEVPVVSELERMFPAKKLATRGSGSMCIGNNRKGEAQWCLAWGEVADVQEH